jgi:putative exporter of polyketide antibiotics
MAVGIGFCTMLYVTSGTVWCSHAWLFTEVTSKVLGHFGGLCPVHIVAYGVIFINIYIRTIKTSLLHVSTVDRNLQGQQLN